MSISKSYTVCSPHKKLAIMWIFQYYPCLQWTNNPTGNLLHAHMTVTIKFLIPTLSALPIRFLFKFLKMLMIKDSLSHSLMYRRIICNTTLNTKKSTLPLVWIVTRELLSMRYMFLTTSSGVHCWNSIWGCTNGQDIRTHTARMVEWRLLRVSETL